MSAQHDPHEPDVVLHANLHHVDYNFASGEYFKHNIGVNGLDSGAVAKHSNFW